MLQKSTIVTKDRAVLTYMDNDRNMITFRGQDTEVGASLSGSFKKEAGFMTKPSSLGNLSGQNGSRPYAMASTGGMALRDIKVDSHKFYGEDTFKNVPSGILCNAYLTMKDSEGESTSIFVELTDSAGRIGRVELTDAPKPAYKYKFEADTVKVFGPELDMNVATDLVASDWNGDGFSDYILSYVHNPNGNNNYAEDMRIALLYIDGKSLYERITLDTGSVLYSADTSTVCSTKKSVAGGRTDVKPANSVRTAVGDVDGDGVDELALVFTTTGDGSDDNGVYVFDVSWDGSKVSLSKLFGAGEGVGSSYLQNDSVGVAIGNLDGDAGGTAEVCVLHGKTSALYQKSTIYLDIYQYNHDSGMKKIVEGVELARTYNVLSSNSKNKNSIAPIEVAANDLDGDGRDELIWLAIDEDDEYELALYVHKWSGESITDKGTVREYNISDMAGWKLDTNFIKFSMATGVFNYPTSEVFVNTPRHIAIAHMGGTSTGSASRNLDWAIFTWNASGGLQVAGNGLAADVQKADNVAPRIVAANIDNEGFVLGEPTAITVTDNVELVVAMQAPPKHWDIISGDFNGNMDEAGNSWVDVFANLAGYNTTFNSKNSSETIKMTGTSENWSVGGGGGFSLSVVNIFKENTPLFNIAGKYTYDEVSKNTSSETMTTSLTQMTAAQKDDQLYYTANDYTIWRYPILFPLDQRTEVVDDEEGNPQTVQKFVQYVVPEKIGSTGLSTPGRDIAWYEPEHDTLNLFTYPSSLVSMKNYPKGEAAKSPADPWYDKNGIVIGSMAKQQIGNPDTSNVNLTISSNISTEDVQSLSHTAGGNASGGFGGGIILAKAVSLNMAGDYSFQSSTTSKSNASQMNGATINWPGVGTYSNRGGFDTADQTFYSDIAIFTQDAGAFNVAYAVTSLKNVNSDIWGANSPYSKTPDPGFVLPNRFTYEKEFNKKSDALEVRGLSFNAAAYDYEKSGAEGKALPLGTEVTGKVRVVNYSFVDTEPFSVEVSYQRASISAAGYVEAPDASKATSIASVRAPFIYGREKNPSYDNWTDVEFKWNTGQEVGIGYLHFKIVYASAELNTGNNYGYALVGVYDPENVSAVQGAVVAGSARGAGVNADLSIKSLTVRGANGRTLTDHNALPIDEELEIECTVGLSSNGNAKIKALPMVQVLLLANDGVVGGKYTPLLLMDKEWTFVFNYDPSIHKDLVSLKELRLVATSPYIPSGGDADSSNNVYRMAFADGSSSGNGDSSGSSGCNAAGAATLAMLALGLGVAGKVRRKEEGGVFK